ncbi:MAG: hypothetical protein CVU11_04335 [Bacteroidetes bacterium HGW-Bacteroidetes-6]|jgi:gliding motility-associated-like protein|nr:MAG: hypothetical protein CVU11_04335 [Bacteroidetes bacterium HGW-Bacteroidetes-6]
MRLICLFIVSFFALFNSLCFAQNHNNNWYFGSHAGLTFNTNPPSALTNGQLSTFEGCASISDNLGQIMFYTDGSVVYNRNHVTMANGSGLLGSWSSTQSAIIVPLPGSDSLYYIFTVAKEAESDGLRYSIVDISQNSGLGAVVQKNVTIRTPVVEKIAAIKHSNCVDIWIVCHGWNNNEFYSYLLTSSGISSTPVISAVGTVHDVNGGLNTDNWIGYMRVSSDRTKIAVAVRQKSLYEVFQFDAASGALSNPLSLSNIQTTTNFAYGAYGLEFSPNSRFLYVKNLGPGDVFQYDLSVYNQAAVDASKTLVGNISGAANYQTGAMQLGPDGRIYIVKYNQPYLGVISSPNNAGLACNLIDNAISLNSRNGQLGLPSLIANDFLLNNPIDASVTGCYDEEYFFTISDSTAATGVFWDFDDSLSGLNNSSTLFSPEHEFSESGSYCVTAVVSYSCKTDDSLLFWIEVAPKPTLFQTDSIAACSGDTVIAQVLGIWDTYLWNTFDTLSYLNLTQSGSFVVSAIDSSGCNVSDTIVAVFNNATIVNVDTVLCDGDSILFQGQLLNATGVYQFSYISSHGCDSSFVLSISAETTPNVALPTDTILCEGQVLIINPILSGSYSSSGWVDGLASSIRIIDSAGLYSYEATGNCGAISDAIDVGFADTSYLELDTLLCDGAQLVFEGQVLSIAGEYTFNYFSQYGCDSTIVLNLFTDLSPVVELPNDTALCEGQEFLLIPNLGGSFFSIEWMDGYIGNSRLVDSSGVYSIFVSGHCGVSQDSLRVFFNDTSTVIIDTTICEGEFIIFDGHIIEDPGQYLFDYLSSNGCDSSISINLTIDLKPQVFLISDTSICSNSKLFVEPVIIGLWDTAYWLDGYLDLSRWISEAGHYVFEVGNQCGKVDEKFDVLIENCFGDIWFPNAFSPNGDGINSIFKPMERNVEEFRLLIYNRWGQQLFESFSIDEGWDGSFNGQDCPIDVYVWVADYWIATSGTRIRKHVLGSVTLIR